MPIQNFLDKEPQEAVCHEGRGLVKIASLFGRELAQPLRFLHYTVLPPGTSIGRHTHANDQEVYIVLEGCGIAEIQGRETPVRKGDVILNRPFGTHALYNTSDSDEIKLLVFEVGALP